MPIYNLKCLRCGTVAEYIIRDGGIPSCVKCGSIDFERVYSGSFSFTIGYPGWVDKIDDYQKRQEDKGIDPTLPHPSEIL